MTEKRKTSAGSEDEYQDFHPENYFPTENYRKMEDSKEAGSPAEPTASFEKTKQNVSVSNETPTKRISNR